VYDSLPIPSIWNYKHFLSGQTEQTLWMIVTTAATDNKTFVAAVKTTSKAYVKRRTLTPPHQT